MLLPLQGCLLLTCPSRVGVAVNARVSIFHHSLLCLLFPTPGTGPYVPMSLCHPYGVPMSPAVRIAQEVPSLWYSPNQEERECHVGKLSPFSVPLSLLAGFHMDPQRYQRGDHGLVSCRRGPDLTASD